MRLLLIPAHACQRPVWWHIVFALLQHFKRVCPCRQEIAAIERNIGDLLPSSREGGMPVEPSRVTCWTTAPGVLSGYGGLRLRV